MSRDRENGPGCDARLHPWCLVPVKTGENHLFGFAMFHPQTGGLSWMVSSELLELDPALDRARTRSGRRYLLGRRFEPIDIGAEGEEARLAFVGLIGKDFAGAAALRQLEDQWVVACKMARHLGLAPPPCRSSDIRQFLFARAAAYFATRYPRT